MQRPVVACDAWNVAAKDRRAAESWRLSLKTLFPEDVCEGGGLGSHLLREDVVCWPETKLARRKGMQGLKPHAAPALVSSEAWGKALDPRSLDFFNM